MEAQEEGVLRLSRRLKRIIVMPELLLDLFKTGEIPRIKIEGAPKGSEFRGIVQDWERNCFAMFISDESFDLIPEGQIVPILQVRITREFE